MSKSHKAKVFEGHKCTTGIHNALLDVVMPELSPTAWKLLCVIIRQTTGWDREEQGASYLDLMKGTGIKSRATIAACLKELNEYRYPLINVVPGTQHDESTYAVNRDVEIDWTPRNFAQSSGSKNELLKQSSSSKNELLSGSKNELLKQSSSSKNEPLYIGSELIYLKQEGEEPLSDFISEIWEQAFGEQIGIHRLQQLEAAKISDPDIFQHTLNIWKTNGYSLRNLSAIISRYQKELKTKSAEKHNAEALSVEPRYNCAKCQDRFVIRANGKDEPCDCWQKVRAA